MLFIGCVDGVGVEKNSARSVNYSSVFGIERERVGRGQKCEIFVIRTYRADVLCFG